MEEKLKNPPKQAQEKQPGKEHKMTPTPEIIREDYKGSDKLKGKVALITGGDSGIGRAIAVHYAREGADVAIVYLDEDKDAEDTKKMVQKEGQQCLLFRGNIRNEEFCRETVRQTNNQLGHLDILVNNAAEHYPKEEFEAIGSEQFRQTFETNIFSFYYFAHEAMNYLNKDSTIINTTSVTAYRGSQHLIDYAATKGAIVAFTRSLSKNLAQKGIRVNAVAPGPIYTPLIPASFDADHMEKFGRKTPLGRPGQPSEVGPAYVFLASKDASYITGQVIHVNGGEVVGG